MLNNGLGLCCFLMCILYVQSFTQHLSSKTNYHQLYMKISKPSSINREGLTIFKNKYPNPRPGSSYDITDDVILDNFKGLVDITKDESIAIDIIKTIPSVLTIKSSKNKETFDVFVEKFGYEESLGLIRRNPNILFVPARGYGSAEASGKDTLYISYLIQFTRPFGLPLLILTFIAVLTPFVKEYIIN